MATWPIDDQANEQPKDDRQDNADVVIRITMKGRLEAATRDIKQIMTRLAKERQHDSFILRAQCWEVSGKFAPRRIPDILHAYLEIPDLLEEQYDYVTLDNSLHGMLQQRLRWWLRDQLAIIFEIDGPVERRGEKEGGGSAHG